MIRFILMDIEGTTTSIDFVHQTLFPYAAKHLPGYIQTHQNQPEIQLELEKVKQTVREEAGKSIEGEGVVQQLLQWIEEDRKHPALKAIQGYLWRDGYEQGEYQGHVYDDVVPAWNAWKEKGLALGIYSSGSVPAQKLLFGYSEQGDLTPYLSAYFDTGVGHKREVDSYRQIANQLILPADSILFLSDVKEELDAAKEAGYQVIWLERPGTTTSPAHPVVRSFTEIEPNQW
ncbi:MAG: acireductone synthase [Bacteroidota bacterium]